MIIIRIMSASLVSFLLLNSLFIRGDCQSFRGRRENGQMKVFVDFSIVLNKRMSIDIVGFYCVFGIRNCDVRKRNENKREK